MMAGLDEDILFWKLGEQQYDHKPTSVQLAWSYGFVTMVVTETWRTDQS